MDLKFFNGPTVPINELLVPLLTGGVEEPAEYHIRRLGITVVEDWFGRRALKVEDARRVVQAYRTAKDEHSAKWDRYQAWQQAEKERKAKERAAAFAAQRAEIERVKDAKRQQWLREELESREAALAAAEQARGVSFEEWERQNVSLLTDTPS